MTDPATDSIETAPVKKPDVTVRGPAASVNAGDLAMTPDSDLASKKQQDLLEAARSKKLLPEENLKKLKPWEMDILSGMKCCENSAGGLTILGADGKPAIEIRPDVILSNRQGESGSQQDIDNVFRMALIGKSQFGDKTLYVQGENEQRLLILAKAHQLAGITVGNAPPPGQTLDEKYPEIAARMDATWKKMGGTVPEKSAGPQAQEVTAEKLGEMLKSGKPLLLEITSKDCTWCGKEAPEMNKVAAQAGDKAPVVKIDLMELHKYMDSLPKDDPLRKQLEEKLNDESKFGVPAIAVFDQGQMKAMQSGFQPADKIVALFNGNIGSGSAIPAASASGTGTGPALKPQ